MNSGKSSLPSSRVSLPAYCYEYIQKLRQQDKWTERKGLCPVSNFRYQFRAIMKKAGIEKCEFHDLRRTCLTNWLANGLSEYDVMTMAGHASFETTRRFYLAVRSDLLDCARKASSAGGVGRGITPRPQPQRTCKFPSIRLSRQFYARLCVSV